MRTILKIIDLHATALFALLFFVLPLVVMAIRHHDRADRVCGAARNVAACEMSLSAGYSDDRARADGDRFAWER